MKNLYFLLFSIFLITSCKNSDTSTTIEKVKASNLKYPDVEIKYATGFSINSTDTGYYITIKNPWPEADLEYSFKLENGNSTNRIPEPDAPQIINIPIKEIILSSTTHIPPVVLIDEQSSIIGFPGTDYISDNSVRTLIDKGRIEELGQNQTISVEKVLTMQPDLVMGYGIDGDNPIYESIQKAGIPVIYNGDWIEKHPLGKAEWIKLFGVLYGKEKEADRIFKEIEKEYLETKKLAQTLESPSIIAGATWKDTWYLPYGNSWQGKIIADANGNYIYTNTTGTGSLSYNVERVLTDAQNADIWIAPGQYTSYRAMEKDNSAYSQFDAFKNRQVYTFALNVGARGGVTYYEEASTRPDLVLKDLVKILHPNSLPQHQLYFFKPLND
ncbi:ABC transporter substrate-binding protein [Nonlabens ulvanivorans]|uniref:ABC transporter substrate-binding protein n=1 Tax=Nonlabens ulvanivorans TaxID=906888 RepID=A0A084JWG3_NONUL|nr:ABC transporter substrate-binding protein [Nonlabens ulvanivorans]KEZ93297.1 ABC transporter substrate-binding protein [Nonlabens ulvanivorans]PRX13579.1 iron complex transport system substrate-binding protein [Nonlabens ulvanivorans]